LKKLQNDKENLNLISSTQDLILGEDSKYQFLFYLNIILECFNTELIKNYLLAFKPEKIIEIGEIEEKRFYD